MHGYEVQTEIYLPIPPTENFQQKFQCCYSKYKKKSGFREMVIFQHSIDHKISHIQHRDLNYLVRPISSIFVFSLKRFEQDLKFWKSRKLTLRARSFNMVWQIKLFLSSKFIFGSNINLGTHLNFVSQIFKCNIMLSKNVGPIVPPPPRGW